MADAKVMDESRLHCALGPPFRSFPYRLPLSPVVCTVLSTPHSALRLQMCACPPVVGRRRMLMRGRGVRLVPATPLGCIELLMRSGVDIQVRPRRSLKAAKQDAAKRLRDIQEAGWALRGSDKAGVVRVGVHRRHSPDCLRMNIL